MPEIDGVSKTVKNGFNFIGEKTSDFKMTLKKMMQNMGHMVFHLLQFVWLTRPRLYFFYI